MKFIITILLLLTTTVSSFACQIQVPTSEAQRYIDALEKTGQGVPPLFKCEDKPEEKCHCVDDVIWEQAEIIDESYVDEESNQVIWSKKIINSKPKKAANEAKKQAEKELEVAKVEKLKAIKEKLKRVKKSDLTSNAKTVGILMEVIELIK